MKTLLYIIICLSLSNIVLGQSPYAFNYQGLARDGSGNIMSNEDITLRISLVESFNEGTIVFVEEFDVTTSEAGLFSIRIGEGIQILGNLRAIDWGSNKYYIKTEMDPSGGNDFIDMGTTQLYSVPYALYAERAGEGGSSQGSDNQQLSLNGTTLSIQRGNSVNLSILQDGFEDADANPSNELQMLSINNNTLSISNGNSITLPSGNGSGGSFWEERNGSELLYNGERVGIGTTFNEPAVSFQVSNGNVGLIKLSNGTGMNYNRGIWADASLGIYGTNVEARLMYLLSQESGDYGRLRLFNSESRSYLSTNLLDSGSGFLELNGPNGEDNIRLSSLNNSPNNGFVAVANENGDSHARLFVGSNGDGRLLTIGPNGSTNINMSSLSDNPNNGFISLRDDSGAQQAGIYVDEFGDGVVFADIKNFRTPYHKKNNHDIVYASVEGPEAAAYLRGTSQLIEGKAQVNFPDHFEQIICDQSITVQLTPSSPDSKGLAVTTKGIKGFTIKELFNGTGNYKFDWEVKAVRKGYENYKVIRKRPQMSGMNDKEAKVQNNSYTLPSIKQ